MRLSISAALIATAFQAHAQWYGHEEPSYEPEYKAPAADYQECPDMEHLEHFDTPEYQSMSAYCKQQLIWKRVIEDRTPERFFVGNEFASTFEQDFNLTFDLVSDTMPIGRIKKTHPRGTTTLVEFIPTYDTPYTGIF